MRGGLALLLPMRTRTGGLAITAGLQIFIAHHDSNLTHRASITTLLQDAEHAPRTETRPPRDWDVIAVASLFIAGCLIVSIVLPLWPHGQEAVPAAGEPAVEIV